MLLANIQTRYEFAQVIGIELKELTYVLYIEKIDNLYTTFSIPKKNGGERQINAPQKKLKYIQKRLKSTLEAYSEQIYNEQNVNTKVSHAFMKGKSIISNARVHKNRKYVINVDLESFFDSFNFGRVRGYFIKNKYWNLNPNIATLIAQIACYKGTLPQGAPTSPIITNLICNIMDWHITLLAKKYKLTYTRYADDLTFTTNDENIISSFSEFIDNLREEIEKSGFRINNSKTRFTDYYHRQEVTGLVVNKKVSVKREYYKKTYAMAHNLYRTGEFTIDGKNGTIHQLEGRFAFIDHIDKFNNKLDIIDKKSGKKHNAGCLSHRERKYQEFLFYRYFCSNTFPLIITEGKTDCIYLRTALKCLQHDYPSFVYNREGSIEYKIALLRKSDRLEYFFYLQKDGASPLTNVLKMYDGKEPPFKEGYQLNLIEKYGVCPTNPVILLYDNEMENKDKPIKQLINKKRVNKEKLLSDSFVRVTGNLYVQVVPLVKGKRECEIEDLISEEVDDLIIDGRKFDRTGKKDIAQYYNKDILSHYVEHHHEEFHFDYFSLLFDTWQKIIEDYKQYLQKNEN